MKTVLIRVQTYLENGMIAYFNLCGLKIINREVASLQQDAETFFTVSEMENDSIEKSYNKVLIQGEFVYSMYGAFYINSGKKQLIKLIEQRKIDDKQSLQSIDDFIKT